MKIVLKADHKSIKERIDFELPNFSVLTGKNGSGKTHLLEALANKDLTDVLLNGTKLANTRYIPFNGLNPNIQENCALDIKNPHVAEEEHKYTSSELLTMLHESFQKSDKLLSTLRKELNYG